MKWFDLQKQMRVGEVLKAEGDKWEGGHDVHSLKRTTTGFIYWYDTLYSMAKFGVFNNPGHYWRGRVTVDVNGIFDEIPDHIVKLFQLAA